MKTETESLTALPLQLIELHDGILLKRGVTELLIRGERAAAVVSAILRETGARPMARNAICDGFAGPDRPAVLALIEKLVKRRILVPVENGKPRDAGPEESAFEIFCWNFGTSEQTLREKLRAQQIVIIGVNEISRGLVDSLRACGLAPAGVVDFPLMRNQRFFSDGELKPSEWPHPPPMRYQGWQEAIQSDQSTCLVPTSDFGGMAMLREWNDLCVLNGFRLFPVVLQDMVGYVGPFVVPGETPCYECFRARQNAHFNDPARARAAESTAFEGQNIVGYHPAMASILANVVAMELTKIYSETLPFIQVGKLIEVNLMRPQIETHHVLKLPRCTVCSPLRWHASTAPTKSTFIRPDPVQS